MVDKLYHRANPRSSFGLIACFVVEIQHFVCDRATIPIIEKLQSKGVGMHAYGISACYTQTGNQLNGPGKGLFKMNVKIIEFRRPRRQPIVLRCPRSLKGELTYSSSMNLAVSRQPAGGNSNQRPQQRAPGMAAVSTRWVKMKAYFAFIYSTISLCRRWQHLEQELFDIYMTKSGL